MEKVGNMGTSSGNKEPRVFTKTNQRCENTGRKKSGRANARPPDNFCRLCSLNYRLINPY
jgi:hypothetical protein